MKVLLLGGSNSRNAGGIFNTTKALGKSLNTHCGADVHFMMHDDEYSAEDRRHYEPLPLHSYALQGPKQIGYSAGMLKGIEKIKPDVVHTQGLWMYFSCANKRHNAKTGTPYVVSPHGMLDRWQLKQSFLKDLKKKAVLCLYERQHLQNASCIHALCKDEYEAIRAFGIKAPVAIIPNGTHLPAVTGRDEDCRLPFAWPPRKEVKTLLFLSRIHQKKGLDVLLQAWSLAQAESQGWQLVIAGETKDREYLQSLLQKTERLKIKSSVSFIGNQVGEKKAACFIDADAFILPSYSEGLPLAVLEAWSYKLPVVMTPFCNLPEGFGAKAAIKVLPEAESIAGGLQKLFSLNGAQRSQMGINGHGLVTKNFTWQSVAASTMQLYNWIAGKESKPSFVFD